ncbi:hypothetical protein HYQ44_014846 [Verticillium longisporum]|nr:hypothetical protein HYQ44_014846 [Verticillium longisporum]
MRCLWDLPKLLLFSRAQFPVLRSQIPDPCLVAAEHLVPENVCIDQLPQLPTSFKAALAAPPAMLLATLAFLSAPSRVAAHPYPLQNTNSNNYDAGFRFIMPRDCVQRCGSDGQYCCGSGEVCFTSANIAGCSGGAGGNYGIYTTTWTETKTFTSTVTTPFPAAPTVEHGGGVGGSGVCVPQAEGETSCGSICCAAWQQCASEEKSQCEQRPGFGGGIITTTVTDGSGQTITTRYSAPYRVTSTTFTNSAGSATSTGVVGTGTAIPNEGDNGEDGGTGGGGLSAGAIAGIVIGTLAGIALLILICFCCIARGLWALLCGGKKKKDDRRRERTEVYEEHYRGGSRMPSTHSRRDRHTGWFGGRPASASARRDPEKDRSSGAKWLGLGAGAATLLALLNLRKDKKPARKARSRYTDSYYSYTDSGSSAGRTNRTRRTEPRAESRYSRR